MQKSDRRAVLRVCDTGVVITADLLPTIFGPFIQAKQTLARNEGGLGLALVRGLAELHGGRVSAASAGPGTGTEFRVELPLVEALRSPEPSRLARGARRAYRVLVVDDNVDAAESLAEIVLPRSCACSVTRSRSRMTGRVPSQRSRRIGRTSSSARSAFPEWTVPGRQSATCEARRRSPARRSEWLRAARGRQEVRRGRVRHACREATRPRADRTLVLMSRAALPSKRDMRAQ